VTVRNGVLVGNLLRVAFALIAALMGIEARAAGIFRDLTPLDRSGPILLSQAGDVIALRSPGHPGAGLASSMPPAFLAFPLHGGEDIPAKTPAITTGSEPGVGPLDLTPAIQPTLDADLLATHGAVVHAPGGSYAVAILPRYARALTAHAAASGSSTGNTLASIFGITPQANWTIQGIPSNKLTQWVRTGTNEINHLTSLGLNRISKTIGVKITPLPATATATDTTTAAQTLIPPGPSTPSPAPEAYATPEPAGWLVFGLILAAGVLRRRHTTCGLDP
jgi:hypothetical protein